MNANRCSGHLNCVAKLDITRAHVNEWIVNMQATVGPLFVVQGYLLFAAWAHADSSLKVAFNAPPSVPGAPANAADCVRTPSFISALHDPIGADIVASELGASRLKPVTFLRSQGEKILSMSASESAAVWRSSKPPFAACLAQCVRLPDLARTVRITLTRADGKSRCAQLPSDDIPYFQSPAIDCGDGTRWSEVITRPIQGDWLVCATVMNTAPAQSSHNMTVSYEYYSVQIGMSAAREEAHY